MQRQMIILIPETHVNYRRKRKMKRQLREIFAKARRTKKQTLINELIKTEMAFREERRR